MLGRTWNIDNIVLKPVYQNGIPAIEVSITFKTETFEDHRLFGVENLKRAIEFFDVLSMLKGKHLNIDMDSFKLDLVSPKTFISPPVKREIRITVYESVKLDDLEEARNLTEKIGAREDKSLIYSTMKWSLSSICQIVPLNISPVRVLLSIVNGSSTSQSI